MLRQAENRVKIEGILSEIDLKNGSFKKNGVEMESIGGIIKVKVEQTINDEVKNLEIPVHMFASKLTTKGTINPAYENIERIMNSYTSIAAAGSEDLADRIRISNGQIQMNEYYNNNKQLVSFPRITASFATKVKKEEFEPCAEFGVTFYVISKGYELDEDGIETKKYKVTAALPQYGGKVDVIPFFSANENVTSGISSFWNEGDTVVANGRLNFSSTVEKIARKVDFGEAQYDTRTVSVSELLITGGTQVPLDGDAAYEEADIREALVERKNRLENQKERDIERRATKTSTPSATGGLSDLGF